jgi:hypothetical protein
LEIRTIRAIVIIFSVAAIIFAIIFVPETRAPPDIQLLDHETSRYGGIITERYVITGNVTNAGGSQSNPILVGITISDMDGNILYTTNASTQPNILRPGERAQFSKNISDNDLEDYSGVWKYKLSVLS